MPPSPDAPVRLKFDLATRCRTLDHRGPGGFEARPVLVANFGDQVARGQGARCTGQPPFEQLKVAPVIFDQMAKGQLHAGKDVFGERPAQTVQFGSHAEFGRLYLTTNQALSFNTGGECFAIGEQFQAIGTLLENASSRRLGVLALLPGQGLGLPDQCIFQLADLNICFH